MGVLKRFTRVLLHCSSSKLKHSVLVRLTLAVLLYHESLHMGVTQFCKTDTSALRQSIVHNFWSRIMLHCPLLKTISGIALQHYNSKYPNQLICGYSFTGGPCHGCPMQSLSHSKALDNELRSRCTTSIDCTKTTCPTGIRKHVSK